MNNEPNGPHIQTAKKVMAQEIAVTAMEKLMSEGDNGCGGGKPRNRRSILGVKAASIRARAKAANKTHSEDDSPDRSGGASTK